MATDSQVYDDNGHIWWQYDGMLGLFWCEDSKKTDSDSYSCPGGSVWKRQRLRIAGTARTYLASSNGLFWPTGPRCPYGGEDLS